MWGQAADHSSLIDDDPMLARTVGCSLDDWKGLRHEIQHPARPIFQEKDGRLISPYLKEEATKQRRYRKLQAEKSKKAVEARVTRGFIHGCGSGHLFYSYSYSYSFFNKERDYRCASRPFFTEERPDRYP